MSKVTKSRLARSFGYPTDNNGFKIIGVKPATPKQLVRCEIKGFENLTTLASPGERINWYKRIKRLQKYAKNTAKSS